MMMTAVEVDLVARARAAAARVVDAVLVARVAVDPAVDEVVPSVMTQGRARVASARALVLAEVVAVVAALVKEAKEALAKARKTRAVIAEAVAVA